MENQSADKITNLRTFFENKLREAKEPALLDDLRVRMLGRRGELTALLKSLGALNPDERRQFGQRLNAFRQQVETALTDALHTMETRRQEQALLAETVDVTMPGRRRALGHKHPMSIVLDEMIDLFVGMGFTVAEGPDIETDYYNFEALNIPANHAVRDEQDTFYISDHILLRTQTSPVQVRVMESSSPPIRIIAPGAVYRSDDWDATHAPVFHQMEGLLIDKGVTMGDLQGTLIQFAKHILGEQILVRFRPSYFPFTEPSAEMDVQCYVCGGKQSGCRVCKDSGWVELLGCGMVHPRVLSMSGIDPAVYSGYAFGMGVERVALQRFGITETRLLYENDVQFLRQF